eukprot:UN19718
MLIRDLNENMIRYDLGLSALHAEFLQNEIKGLKKVFSDHEANMERIKRVQYMNEWKTLDEQKTSYIAQQKIIEESEIYEKEKVVSFIKAQN